MKQLRVVLAVVAGLFAAYFTMHRLDERDAGLPSAYTITAMRGAPGGVEIELDSSMSLRIDTVGHSANRRKLALLYPGKTVAFASGDDAAAGEDCRLLVPLLQRDRPTLSRSEWARLRRAGLGDRALAVSYTPPDARAAAFVASDEKLPGVCVRNP